MGIFNLCFKVLNMHALVCWGKFSVNLNYKITVRDEI